MPEERGLYPKRQVSEQMVYLAQLRGLNKNEAIVNSEKCLERMQIKQYKSSLLDTLSKGNQQKVQLASMLVNKPDLVILDEPFSGLNPVNSQILQEVIQELIAEGKMVILFGLLSFLPKFIDMSDLLGTNSIVKATTEGKMTKLGIVDEKGYFNSDLLLEQMFPGIQFIFIKNSKNLEDAVIEGTIEAGFLVKDAMNYDYYILNRNMKDVNQTKFSEVMSMLHKQSYCAEQGIDYEMFMSEYEEPIRCNVKILGKDAAMFVRIGMGRAEIWETVLSALTLFVSIIFVGYLSAKIYRLGTLHYGNPVKLTKVFKSLINKQIS